MFKTSIIRMCIIIGMLAGCKSNSTPVPHVHNHDEHGGHSDDEYGLAPEVYTLYTASNELFVELPPLIVGKTSKFATHLTHGGNEFKPFTEGKVTLNLVIDEAGISTTADSVSSPGIFSLALTPNKAGKGTLVFHITHRGVKDKFIINDVVVYSDEKAAKMAQKPEASSGEEISYLKEQSWKVPFATSEVKMMDFNNVIHTSGEVISAPGDEAIVAAKASGILRFKSNNLSTGNFISMGTSLFSIEGGDLAQGNMDVNYAQVKAQHDQAKINFERASELVKDQIISEKEYQNTKLIYDNLKTELSMIGKNYSSGGQKNTAPISGYVKTLSVADGQYVTAGTPLLSLIKNKKVLLKANVSQRYLSSVSTINAANFIVPGQKTVYKTEQLNGRIKSIGRTAEASSPFVPIYFEIDNTIDLVSGMPLEFYLKSKAYQKALVIPLSSIIEEQGKHYVYVQLNGETFEKRQVTFTESDGNNIKIESGLSLGERIVTKGAYQIKLSQAAGTMPAHGHSH